MGCKRTLVVFLTKLLLAVSAQDPLQLSDCLAACQIHDIHVVWEQENKRVEDLKEIRQEGGSGTDRFFTCRTLWDQTIEGRGNETRKYMPLHEIQITPNLLRRYDEQSLEDGGWSLCFSGGSPRVSAVTEDRIFRTEEVIEFGRSFGFHMAAKRQLAGAPNDPDHRKGFKNLLVVRIRTLIGEQPTATKQRLEEAIFGPIEHSNNLRLVSVVDQYKSMSHGLLKYYPATFPHLGVTTGVVDVFFDGFNGDSIQFLSSELVYAVERALGLRNKESLGEAVHHTLFCLPDNVNAPLHGSNFDWTAFTYRYEPYSYYRLNRCSKLSIVAHELGHASLGFRHSGAFVQVPNDSAETQAQNGDTETINGAEYKKNEYADETGYMGYSVNAFGVPQKAMNAHKHWLTRWYNNHAMLHLDPLDGPTQVEVVGYTEYNSSQWTHAVATHRNKAVLLRLGDLYIQYNYVSNNKEKDWNRHTAYPNKVTIVEADGDNSVSFLVGVIEPGLAYIERDYQNSGKAVAIGVCPKDEPKAKSSVDLIIYQWREGKDPPECIHPTPAPSLSPVLGGSPAPTQPPTFAPQQTPSPVANSPFPTDEELDVVIEQEEPPDRTPAGVGKGPVVEIEVPTEASPFLSMLPPDAVVTSAAVIAGAALFLFVIAVCYCCYARAAKRSKYDFPFKQNNKELAINEAKVKETKMVVSIRKPPILSARSSTGSTDPLSWPESGYV